jgi:hypothetical protein
MLAGPTGYRRGERRRVVRPALALVLLFAVTLPLAAQLPADGQTSFSRDDRIKIPFELRAGGRATKVVLYVSHENGPWLEYDIARAGQKREFLFKADRDGLYGFATMTHFSDGTTDPANKSDLAEQRRVVIDRTPPRVSSLRSVTSTDGSPGIEWDVLEDYPHPQGVKLEFRWDGIGRFEPIDRNVPLGPQGNRHWRLKPGERMQVRLHITDRAGNRTESDPVWVGAERAMADVPPRAPAVTGTSTGSHRDAEVAPVAGRRAAQAPLHYVNDKAVKLNVNATAGPSGLTNASLWYADERLEWQKWREEKGKMPAPPNSDPDKPRIIPVGFTFEAPKDGTYSFVIVLENHRGKNRPDPRKGEAGDVQVVVDTTKPAVELNNIRVASQQDRAVVDINWMAKDTNMAPMPIKLEYKAVGGGGDNAWKAITPEWVDNTGQYTWTAPNGDGYLFDIRIVCKDKAGNETTVMSKTPVNVDLARPGVSGVDVAPGKGGGLGPTPGGDGGAFNHMGLPPITVTSGSRKD